MKPIASLVTARTGLSWTAAARRSAGWSAVAAAGAQSSRPMQTRSFTILPRLRPTASASPRSIFRSAGGLPTTTAGAAAAADAATATVSAPALDLIASTSISRHPALAGLASQIRCGPRPTMERTSRLVQKRRHGFLSRVRTKSGRKTLSHRRTKGRKRLSH